MKKSNWLVLFIISALLLILSGCFSPYGADETNITISLGDLGRVAVSSAEINTLSYEIILDGPGGRRTETFSGTSTSIRVRPGTYNVMVLAIGNRPSDYDNDPSHAPLNFPARMLRGWGCEKVTIQRGQDNPIPIKMATATEVTTQQQLDKALDQVLGTREHIIVIKGSITDLPASGSYTISGRVTLVAENASTIDLSDAYFNIPNIADRLTLGKEGMGGILTLDGDGFPTNYPLISVNGQLFMNDGVVLQGRNRNSGRGGGVALNGSEASFTMNGGTISRNTVSSDGGGVLVDGNGTFNMNGGIIDGNTATGSGGGVAVVNGSFTMNGGFITGNRSGGWGHGVHMTVGIFTINSPVGRVNISGNVTDGVGSGAGQLVVNPGATLNNNAGIAMEDINDGMAWGWY